MKKANCLKEFLRQLAWRYRLFLTEAALLIIQQHEQCENCNDRKEQRQAELESFFLLVSLDRLPGLEHQYDSQEGGQYRQSP